METALLYFLERSVFYFFFSVVAYFVFNKLYQNSENKVYEKLGQLFIDCTNFDSETGEMEEDFDSLEDKLKKDPEIVRCFNRHATFASIKNFYYFLMVASALAIVVSPVFI